MLTNNEINAVLEKALLLGADFAELFFEDTEDVTINYSGTVDEVSSINLYGVGIYLISDKKSVYVSTNDVSYHSIIESVEKAARLLNIKKGGGNIFTAPKIIKAQNPCPVKIYPGTVGYKDKIAVLKEADFFARSVTPSLKNIKTTYFDHDQRVRVVNTQGTDAEDRRVTTRIRFIPFLSNELGSASNFFDYNAPAGFETIKFGVFKPYVSKVIKEMESSLSAAEAPSAKVPVIFEGGNCTGTFFHEACGHQLETTSLMSDGLFWDKRGQKIASDKVTLIDDGTMRGMYGSSMFDDEGMPRQKNVLIENGVLKSFLVDRMGSILLDLPRSGSGRRQNYTYAPGSRMSNTYLAAGEDDDDAMIRDTEQGLYVTGLGGGTGGREFTLMANVAYWIKNGRIDKQVKGAMLLGRGDETMLKIDRVGKTLIKEESGGAFCGADSGFCATTTSGPRMRVSEMVVGGKGGDL
jgi:TldD protein